MTKETEPKVSIGLATFNRPGPLARALDHLLAQTWKNIEIIVSDNASDDPEVAEVLRQRAERDHRIFLHRQPRNIGGLANFAFVLNKASADYFMWAADDDEWEPDFISSLMPHLDAAGLAMTDVQTVFHRTGEVHETRMPNLDAKDSAYKSACNFIRNMQPSLVYGVYRTAVLRECISLRNFDFWDCVLVYKTLMRYGVTTVKGCKYRAGVYDEKYKVKLACANSKRLHFSTLVSSITLETIRSSRLSPTEKIRLLWLACGMIIKLRRHLSPIVRHQQMTPT